MSSYFARQTRFTASSVISATASAEPWSGSILDRPREARAGLLLPPEQALDCRTSAGEPRVLRREGDGFQQRVVALGEMPGCRQRP